MSERIRFIHDYQLGVYTMTELCQRYGVSRKTGHKWLLRQCPINLLRQHGRHDKNGSDTAILQFTSGAVCFKCQHDRCQHIKWENLRHIYETIYREV